MTKLQMTNHRTTKRMFVRIAGALGTTSLALFIVGLIPFLAADPSAGAGLAVRAPAFTVDRTYKGDRLPLPSEINSAVSRNETRPQQSQAPKEIPVGCDASFSPVSSPSLAYIFGRCTA
jgi:hypothetical protein